MNQPPKVFPELEIDTEPTHAHVSFENETTRYPAQVIRSTAMFSEPLAVVIGQDEYARRASRLFAKAPEMFSLLQGLLLREDVADDELGDEARSLIDSILLGEDKSA